MAILTSKTTYLTSFIILSSLLFVSGCLPLLTLQGLGTDDTVIFEEKLPGKWYGEDQIWTFTHNEKKEYSLEVTQEGYQGQFEVHLVKLRDNLFLDLYPQKNEDLEHTALIYQIALLPAHVVLYVEQVDDNQFTLHKVQFDKLLDQDPNIIEFAAVDDCPIITAEPEKLQQVLMDNFDTKDVIDKEQFVFHRGRTLYSPIDILFSENLLGQWQSEDNVVMDCIAWENGYDIVLLQDQKEFWFKAFRVTIDQQWYLAVFKCANIYEDFELYPDFLFRIEQEGSTLKLYQVDLYKSMQSGQTEFDNHDIQVFDKL